MADAQKKFISDPDNYREMSKPFDGPDAASKAVDEFIEELYELRNKHRIQNLYVLSGVTIKYEDGHEGEVLVVSHFGDEFRREAMAAFAHGHEASERQERISKMLKQGLKAVKQPKQRD